MSAADLFVKNPHSILIALKKRPKDVSEIVFPKDSQEGVWSEIESLAEKNKIRRGNGQLQKPRSEDRSNRGFSGGRFQNKSEHRNEGRGESRSEGRGSNRADRDVNFGRESGHGALIKPKGPSSLERMFQGIDKDTRGLWIALDCLQDPQNLGAIFRAAAFFGVKGIVMTTERSAPMTSTVYDIACGGVEAVPFVQTINLKQALDKAKEAGLWILGTSEHSKTSLSQVEKDRPWLMVVGNEEKGIRRLTEEACDVMCSIPNSGSGVTSLNVSVATGILVSRLA